MPRVKSQVAAKDYPNAGIKKGEKYYSWKFRYGGAYKSKTPPRPSQLTQSKMSAAYAASESLEDTIQSAASPEEIKDALTQAAEEINAVADDYQDGMDNMAVQGGSIYEESEQKVSDLQDWASSLEQSASDIESLDNYEDWDKLNEEAQSELMDAARDAANENAGCPF